MQGKKWKETELLLVSGGKLNRKRDNKWDMEREREFCVLFHCSLWCGDILGGSGRDGGAFLFRFELYTGFIFPFTFSKPTALFLCPCLQPLPPPFLHPPPFVSCLFDGKLKRSSPPLTLCVGDYCMKKRELDVFIIYLNKKKKHALTNPDVYFVY